MYNADKETEQRYDPEDMKAALDTLKKGGIMLYPTDTIWGIGCDATNKEAVEKIYRLKNRPDSKSMLVLVCSESQLERLVGEIPEAAEMLLETAVNPLTIIYDRANGVAENLLAPDGSIGIRITDELFSKTLCRKFGKPIVSTSANISGQPSPAVFKDISEEIKEGVDYIVRYGQDDEKAHKQSNIIKVSNKGVIKVIR